MSTTAESQLERTIQEEQDAHDQDAAAGQDPDKGQLFEVPRVGVTLDDTDPTVLKLAFSGQINLERATAADVDLYNRLQAGQTVTLQVDAHVAGTKTTHRRDSEGDVDAVVHTKSLIVHSLEAAG